ncbi:MAG: alpha/beta fold hydrolase [Chloroflexota bacterium]
MTDLTYETTSRSVTTPEGIRLHYHEAGDEDADVLVCLHGGGAGSMAWTQYCRNLAPLSEHFHVIMFDLPQYGRSDKPSFEGEDTFPANARVIIDALDALGIQRAHFVGTSQGGTVSAFIARDRPELVGRAVLVSPSGVWDSVFVPTPLDLLKDTMEFYNPGPATRDKLNRILRGMLHDPSKLTPEIEELRWEAASDPVFLEAMADFGATRLGDVRPVLPDVHQEVLVLWGLEDRLLPLDVALYYVKHLPNAELRLLQRVGHWIPFERSEVFNRAVTEFLQRPTPDDRNGRA